MSVIKAGYRITVVSWENDADNYRTITRDGLRKEEVQRDVEFLKLIAGSYNRHDDDNKVFGNLYEPREGVLEEFEAAVRQLMTNYDIEVNEEWPLDYFLEEVCEYTGWSEGYTTRVVEKITVEYVPHEIIIDDVTKEFV